VLAKGVQRSDGGLQAAIFEDARVQKVRTRRAGDALDAVARTRGALETEDEAAAAADRRPGGRRRGREAAAVVAQPQQKRAAFFSAKIRIKAKRENKLYLYPVAASTCSASTRGRSEATAASMWPPPFTVLLDTMATHALQKIKKIQ
jgi:hypothetical protein